MNIHIYANLMFFSLKRVAKTCISFWLTRKRALLPHQEKEDTARREHSGCPRNTCLHECIPCSSTATNLQRAHLHVFSTSPTRSRALCETVSGPRKTADPHPHPWDSGQTAASSPERGRWEPVPVREEVWHVPGAVWAWVTGDGEAPHWNDSANRSSNWKLPSG